MKKTLALILAALMALSMTACSNSDGETENSSTTDNSSSSAAESEPEKKEELILPDLEEKANTLAEKAEKEEAETPSEPSVETTTPPAANTADPDPLLPDSNKKPDKDVTKHEEPKEEEENTAVVPPVKTPTEDEAAQHPGKNYVPGFGWVDPPRTDGGGETANTPADPLPGVPEDAQIGTM